MERIPIKTDPKGFDLAVKRIQERLAILPWLDHIFGICETLTDIKDGKRFTSANLYIGNNHYERIEPCVELGNFAYFVLRDPQTISTRDKRLVRSPFSLIVWYNLYNVSLPTDERNTEAIKAQIMSVLNTFRGGSLTISRIYEKPQNIFSDYSYDHTTNQCLMSPYAGLRIDGEIVAKVDCYLDALPKGDYNIDYDDDYDI